jgi:hypothetical protein
MGDPASYLTDDERKYLSGLFAEEEVAEPAAAEPGQDLRLRPVSVAEERLLTLLRDKKAELVASDGPYKLRFSLQLDPSAPDEDIVRLAVPEVEDHRGVGRGARVRPAPGQVRLEDADAAIERAEVLDISISGAFVLARAAANLESQQTLRALELTLLGVSYPLCARVVRVQELDNKPHCLLAIKFEPLDPALHAALRSYVYERYSSGEG